MLVIPVFSVPTYARIYEFWSVLRVYLWLKVEVEYFISLLTKLIEKHNENI